jgi:glycosyl transferase family 25
MLQGCEGALEAQRVAAQQCAILVINLDRAPERLAFQRAQAKHLGIDFERIPAVDGAKLSAETYHRYARRWQRVMTRNEVACLLSHARCWEHVIELGCNALVLEDDAVLAEELPAFLNEAAALEGCVVVNIETRCRRAFLARERSAYSSTGLYALLRAVSGSAGYLVTPEAAAMLLKGLPHKAGLVDNYIWGKRDVRRLQADPAFCMGLDVMQAHFQLEKTALARSNIANNGRSRAEKILSYCRHPLTAWRRVKAQVSLGLTKIILPWVVAWRVVAPYPSILANYQALKGVCNG